MFFHLAMLGLPGLPASGSDALEPSPLYDSSWDELVPSPLFDLSNDTDPTFDLDLSRLNIKAGNSVVYGVSTCEKYHSTRAMAVHNTWCRNIESCVFYSDHMSKTAPFTIQLDVNGGEKLDALRRAQMRYIRILHHAGRMVLHNRGGLFKHTKWVVVTDDDTYVFHHNMHSYLAGLSAEKPIYTGHTLADSIYPVDSDGEGHTLDVKVNTHFACGGGGSVFSHGALLKMSGTINSCVRDMAPGHVWAGWQSDWVFGACMHRAHVHLLNQPNGHDRFGQFISRDGHQVQLDDPGTKEYCNYNQGYCMEPVSVHPVPPVGMYDLHKELPRSHGAAVKHVKVLVEESGKVIVKH